MKCLRLKRNTTVLLACCLGLSGCGPGQSSQTADLEAKLKTLDEKFSALEAKTAALQSRVTQQELAKDWEGVAYLTPGSDGYSLIKTDLGTLTVTLKDIKPYANGSRVTLQFGNLTSATIDGLKAKLFWGAIEKDGQRINTDAKSREVTFTQSMLSGGWTNAEVVLESVPPTELGYVTVRDVGHRGVRLRNAGV